MEPEGSLPHSQEPATCPYPEPGQCSPSHLWYNLKNTKIMGIQSNSFAWCFYFFEPVDICRWMSTHLHEPNMARGGGPQNVTDNDISTTATWSLPTEMHRHYSRSNNNKLMVHVYIVENTTIFLIVRLLLIRYNYMFRPSMLAIFRLYMKHLTISYIYP